MTLVPRILAALGVALLLAAPALGNDEKPTPPREEKQAQAVAKKNITLRDILNNPVRFDGFDEDPRLTLGETLQFLRDRYGVPFRVNKVAFRVEGFENVLDTPVGQTPIPRMDGGVKLSAVFRAVLNRVPSPTGVTFVVRDGSVEITTRAGLAIEGAVGAGPMGP